MIDPDRPEWLAVLAHEMRTPLASIIGYGELMEDGLFGEIDPKAMDALKRIRFAAMHLNTLVDGIDRLGDAHQVADERLLIPLREMVEEAYDLLRLDADGRGVAIEFANVDANVLTVRDDAMRAIVLALSAAVKASPNQALRIDVSDNALIVSHTRLTDADDVTSLEGPRMSGAGLRIALARQAFRLVGGTIEMVPEPGGARGLKLTFPARP